MRGLRRSRWGSWSAVAALLLASTAAAGAAGKGDESVPQAVVTGVWLGHSYCEAVEGAPACVEGKVRCEFRLEEVADGKQAVRLEMRTVGSGDEPSEEVSLLLDYEPSTWSWTADVDQGRFRGRWTWRIFEFILHGTLTDLETNRVVRRIGVEREEEVKELEP